jgi:hypothetical protein
METKYEFEIFWKQKSVIGFTAGMAIDYSFRTTADAVKKHLSSLLKKKNCFGIGCRKL